MAKDILSVDNVEVHKSKNIVKISVNPRLYSRDTIFSAAYVLIDKAYVIVDGDPNEEIVIQLKAKDKKADLEKLGREFNNELINYSFYAVQTARSMPIRAAMVQRAFFTQNQQEPTVAAMQKTVGGRKVGKSKNNKRKSGSKR